MSRPAAPWDGRPFEFLFKCLLQIPNADPEFQYSWQNFYFMKLEWLKITTVVKRCDPALMTIKGLLVQNNVYSCDCDLEK